MYTIKIGAYIFENYSKILGHSSCIREDSNYRVNITMGRVFQTCTCVPFDELPKTHDIFSPHLDCLDVRPCEYKHIQHTFRVSVVGSISDSTGDQHWNDKVHVQLLRPRDYDSDSLCYLCLLGLSILCWPRHGSFDWTLAASNGRNHFELLP